MSENMKITDFAKLHNIKSADVIKAINKHFKDANISERAFSKKMEKEWLDWCTAKYGAKSTPSEAPAEKEKKKKHEEPVQTAADDEKKSTRKFAGKIKHKKDEEEAAPPEEETPVIEEETKAETPEVKQIEKIEIPEEERDYLERKRAPEKKPEAPEKPAKEFIEVKVESEDEKRAKARQSADADHQRQRDDKRKEGFDRQKQQPQGQQRFPRFDRTKKADAPKETPARPVQKFEEVKPLKDNQPKAVTSDDIYAKKKKKKKKRNVVDKQKIAQSFEKTMNIIKAGKAVPKKKHREKDKEDGTEEELNKLMISDYIILSDLADKMDVDPVEVIEKAIQMGIMVTINQRLDFDNASLLAMEFGYEVERIVDEASVSENEAVELEEEGLEKHSRAPVVTIMGHVDHGKTTLIDFLRKSRIVDSEHGKITQDIGAYRVKTKHGMITVIDTPGHEAFTAMRARGAEITDMAIIVIAANDGVMPQTVEAINHARIANLPIIVAINKIDLPEADPEKIKRQLLNHNIIPTDFGGKIPVVNISAKTGKGVDELLDTIIIQAELLELKSPLEGFVRGTVLEVRQDKGLGPVINCLIQRGTLKKDDVFIAGSVYGRVRKMLNEFREEIKEATPSMPVAIVGASSLPEVGDVFRTLEDEKKAKEAARKNYFQYKEQLLKKREITSLDGFEKQLELMKKKEIKVIIKGKVYGSIEALADSLQVLKSNDVIVSVIYKEVGIVTENDVNAAIASKASIIAFNTSVDANARLIAKREGIIIKQYNIIYDVIDDIQISIESMNEPVYENVITGSAEVRKTFKISRLGVIAGLYVTEGSIARNSNINVIRKGEDMGTFPIKTLKRFQDDVKQVEAGYECAILLDGFDDAEEGDVYKAIIKKKIES